MINLPVLNKLAQEIHKTNVEKGFWEDEDSILTKSSLIISELYEMVEAHRKDRWCNINVSDFEYMTTKMPYVTAFQKAVKDTVEDELADAIIRCLDLHQYLYEEVVIVDTEREQIDYGYLNSLSPKTNTEDLHGIILALASVVMIGPEYVLQPLFILCDKLGMEEEDILFHIEQKMKYNKTRSKLHGKKY